MISRASTRFGTPAAIVTTVTISAFVSKSRPIVTRCAIVQADGIRWRFCASAFSARRPRVVYSLAMQS